VDELERTGCAVLAAIVSGVLFLVTAGAYLFVWQKLHDSPGYGDLALAIYTIVFGALGATVSWSLAAVAALFRRKVVWLLLFETPFVLFSVYLFVDLYFWG
jgi:hypothetical protein